MTILLALGLLACTKADDTDITETDADTNADTDPDTDPSADTDTDDPVLWEPDPLCDWYDAFHFAVECGEWTEIYEMRSLSDRAGCEPWYQKDGDPYRTIDDLLADGCDSTCVYGLETYVMFLYCENRSEYTTYVDGGPGQTGPVGECPTLLHFETAAGSGYYGSREAFEADNPCP